MAEQNDLHASVPQVDYDRHDAKAGLIAAISGSVIALLVVLIGGVYYLQVVSYEDVERDQYSAVPSQELKAIHDREERQLHQYSYIDKEKGIVRLPIDRAIELLSADASAGRITYNTTTYDVKPEPPGGAAGGNIAGAPAPAAATPATTNAQPSASH